MKKQRIWGILALALVFSLVVFGCDTGDDQDDNDVQTEVDFTNHQPGSIRVRNNTNQRLVAFRGLPTLENQLGGIPANATNHGLSRNGFTTSVDFALTLVTETEYNKAIAAGGNQALKNAPVFNVIYAFYNHTGTNNNIFAINAQSGGAGRLIMENPTAWNIELRQNAHNGQTVGFIGPYTATQTLNLEPGDYIFYPVMRRLNPFLGEIIDVQPVFPDGVLANTPFFRPLRIDASPVTWNFREIAQTASVNMVSGAAFIRVVNSATNDAINFYNGTVVQQTSMASTFLMPGETMVFQVMFPRNPDQSFSNTHTANFGVGVPGGGRTGNVPPREVEIDWLYEIQVTGTNASNVTASALTPIQKMDIEGLFNANTN
jgi:hypothetical protein